MEVLEIKIKCICGQRYKFDVEPVDKHMPTHVECPFCGLDGTEAANSVIALYPEPESPESQETDRPLNAQSIQAWEAALKEDLRPLTSSFGMGVCGALLGASLGMLLWYFFAQSLNAQLGFCAVGLGLLAGLGCRWLGHYPHRCLGVIAAIFSLVCMLGAYYLQIRAQCMAEKNAGEEMFFGELFSAKDLIEAVPDGTPEQIQKYLSLRAARNGNMPSTVTDRDVAQFRTRVWEPALALVSGKIDLAHYRQKLHEGDAVLILDAQHLQQWLKQIGVFNLGFALVGLAVAYKLGAGTG